MAGLKEILNERIKAQGQISLDELEVLVKDLGYKLSNAERRLRKSESPEVEPVMNEHHAIIGYRYKGGGDALQKIRAIRQAEEAKNPSQSRQTVLF